MRPLLGSLVVFFLLALLYLSVLSIQVNAQYCGDNFCDPGESGWCSDCDVAGYCGDGFCDADEGGWCSDCSVSSYCGDNFCDPDEIGWCSDCVGRPYCGDGFCDAGEQGSCLSDCNIPPPAEIAELPDLSVGQINVLVQGSAVSSVAEGDSVTFTAAVANNEPHSAGRFQVTWFIDGAIVRSEQSPGLPGHSTTVSSVSWKAVAGLHGISVLADSSNDVEESNEANNAAPLFALKVGPKCEPKYLDTYRCSGSQREILELQSDCTTQNYVPVGEPCDLGCREANAPTDANPDRRIAFCVSPPPIVVEFDNPPAVTISLPPSAAPGSQLGIVVTGTDDRDVAQLLLYNGSSNLLETFDCVGIQVSCGVVFTKRAPAAQSTPYAFKARSKDSAGQFSGFVSATGTTTAAPVVPPVVPPPVTPPPVTPPVAPPPVPELALPKPLQVVSIKFPLQPLFLRALNFPDSDCVRPGESALLAVKVQNTAKSTLKDVSFAATVPELGIRASGGPIKLSAKDKSTRLLRIDVPQGAKENTYYLRFTISNNKFKRTIHRSFVVGTKC